MGPSILAAAMTTIAASIAMLFSSINFFHKFGNILLWSLVMGVFGSMFVFLVLVDTFGPNSPGALCSWHKHDDELESSGSSTDTIPLPTRASNLKHEVEAGMEALANRTGA